MPTIFYILAIGLLALVMITALFVLVFISIWRIIYYALGCRKAPIQKTVLIAAAAIWIIAGGFFTMLP